MRIDTLLLTQQCVPACDLCFCFVLTSGLYVSPELVCVVMYGASHL